MRSQRPAFRPSAIRVYVALEAVRGLGRGLVVVAAIYAIEIAGFGPLELVLAGTALEVAAFTSEIPTGIVADLYSRRLSVIIGAFVMGTAWVIEGSFPLVWTILGAQALQGVGWTFFSGASEAWIAGEVGERAAARSIVRGTQAHLVGQVAGAFGAVALGAADLRWPLFAAGASHVLLGFILILTMPERGFTRQTHRGAANAFSATLRGSARAVRVSPVLITILVATVLAGAASEGLDRLWQPHLWLDLDIPDLGADGLLVFALVSAAVTVLSVPALAVSQRWVARGSQRALATTAAVVAAAVAGGTILFGSATTAWVAIVAYLATRMARNVEHPTYAVWLVGNTPPAYRATVISMHGQSHALGEIAAGPSVGIVGRLVSIPAALVVSGVIQAVAVPLLAREAARSSGESG